MFCGMYCCLVLHFLLLRQKKTKQKKRRLRAYRSAGSKQLYAVGNSSIGRYGAGFLSGAFFLFGWVASCGLSILFGWVKRITDKKLRRHHGLGWVFLLGCVGLGGTRVNVLSLLYLACGIASSPAIPLRGKAASRNDVLN